MIKELIIAFINLIISIELLMCLASVVTAALVVKLVFCGAGAPGYGDEEAGVARKDALWGVWDVFPV